MIQYFLLLNLSWYLIQIVTASCKLIFFFKWFIKFSFLYSLSTCLFVFLPIFLCFYFSCPSISKFCFFLLNLYLYSLSLSYYLFLLLLSVVYRPFPISLLLSLTFNYLSHHTDMLSSFYIIPSFSRSSIPFPPYLFSAHNPLFTSNLNI